MDTCLSGNQPFLLSARASRSGAYQTWLRLPATPTHREAARPLDVSSSSQQQWKSFGVHVSSGEHISRPFITRAEAAEGSLQISREAAMTTSTAKSSESTSYSALPAKTYTAPESVPFLVNDSGLIRARVGHDLETDYDSSEEISVDLDFPSPLPEAALDEVAELDEDTGRAKSASSTYRSVASRLERSIALPDSAGAGLVDISCDRRHDKPTLVLMRHGESMWNHLKLFTGDVDIPLTEKGVVEALAGGRCVADIDFSMIFTSRLMRSKQTALLAMTQNKHKGVPVIIRGGFHGRGKTGDANRLRLRAAAAQALKQAECRMIPVFADPALNERCYGDLQGLNKQAAEETFGKEQVAKWRRSHDTRPPKGESLKDTWERSLQFFTETIEPRLEEGRNVLVVAHGNVLRCLLSYLSNLTEDEMLRLQIGTALPYAFRYRYGDDSYKYEHIIVKPVLDSSTGEPVDGVPMGLTSVLKKGAADSLI